MSAFSRTIEQLRGLVAGEIVAAAFPLDVKFRRADPTVRLERQPIAAYAGPVRPFQIRPKRRSDRVRTTGALEGVLRDTTAQIEVVVGYLEGHVDDLDLTMVRDDDRLLRLLFWSENWDTDNTGCELCFYEGSVYQPEPDGPRALLIQTWRLELHDSWQEAA